MYKNITIDVAPVVLEFVLSPADLRLKGAGTEARRDRSAQGQKRAGTEGEKDINAQVHKGAEN